MEKNRNLRGYVVLSYGSFGFSVALEAPESSQRLDHSKRPICGAERAMLYRREAGR